MVKKQVIASLAFGVMCGFGGAEAMKSPYMVCPEAPGKDQYFSASETMPCKIYEVDFQLKDVEGTPEKKIRVAQILQDGGSPIAFIWEGYGKKGDDWNLEVCSEPMDFTKFMINGHDIAIDAKMDSNQIVSQLAKLGEVVQEDSTINLLRDNEAKK